MVPRNLLCWTTADKCLVPGICIHCAVIRSGDKYMFDELSEDELNDSAPEEEPPISRDLVDNVPFTPDWRQEKIGVGPMEVCFH